MLLDPEGHRESVEKFLAAVPLSGEAVLAERIKAIAAAGQDDVTDSASQTT